MLCSYRRSHVIFTYSIPALSNEQKAPLKSVVPWIDNSPTEPHLVVMCEVWRANYVAEDLESQRDGAGVCCGIVNQ